MVMALLLGIMWVTRVIGDVLFGNTPKATDLVVFPLDLVIAFPALFWGGLWLWRKQPLGYVVGAVVLTKAAAEGLSLVFQTGATMVMSGIGDELLPAYAVAGIGGLVLLAIYLRSVVSPTPIATFSGSTIRVPAHA